MQTEAFIDLPHGGLTNTMQALSEAYLSHYNLTVAQSDRLPSETN